MDFLLPVRDVSHYSICTVTSVTNITVIYVVTVMPRAKVATPARFRQETIAVRQMLGRVEKVGLHPAIAGGSFAGQNCHIPGQSFASPAGMWAGTRAERLGLPSSRSKVA